jgi:hypothetical protein
LAARHPIEKGDVVGDTAPTLIDYEGYVEFGAKEGDGGRGLFPWPTDSEVIRCCPWAKRLADPDATVTLAEFWELGRTLAERQELYDISRQSRSRCFYCGGALEHVRPAAQHVGHDLSLLVCRSCGWWSGEDFVTSISDGEWEIARERVGILRRFALDCVDTPIELIRKHLARNPDDSRWLHPRRLEDLVGQVFADFLNCEAVYVGGRGDGGVDLLLLEGEEQRAVQVKRRHVSAPEGVAFIREFVGAMLLRGDTRGLYVTTAPRFTPAAEDAARTAEERGLVKRLDLVANPRLTALCRLPADAQTPWEIASEQFCGADTGGVIPGSVSSVAQVAVGWFLSGASLQTARLIPGLVSDLPS